MHDFVDLVHDQPHYLGLPWLDNGIKDDRSLTVAKPPLVGDIEPGQAMTFPELLPEFLLAVGRVDG